MRNSIRTVSGLVIASLAAAGFIACSSDSTTTQSPTGSAPSPSNPVSRTATSSSPATTSSSTSHASFGSVQPAVDAFDRLSALYNAALQNPRRATAKPFDRYVAGDAKLDYEQSLTYERAHGMAYTGTPPVNRLVVKSQSLAGPVPSVTLENCALLSTSDPWTEYVVKSGSSVPRPSTSKVPLPYPTTIKMFKPTRAGWVVTSFSVDGSRTCSR